MSEFQSCGIPKQLKSRKIHVFHTIYNKLCKNVCDDKITKKKTL